MKKTLIIILIFIAILAVGLGVYFAWSKSRQILNPPLVAAPVVTPSASNQTAQETGKLKAISDNKASAYWIYRSPSSTDVYYFNESGQLFKIKDGEDEKIINDGIGEIKSIAIDKDGKKVAVDSGEFTILTISASGLIKESLAGALAVTFSPDSDKMAYLDDKGNFNIMDYSAKLRSPKTTKILTMSVNDPVLSWIAGDKIILSSRPSAFYINESWIIDINKKTIAPFSNARGLTLNWSSDGKEAIKFTVDASFNPSLSLIDNTNSIKANFDFSSLPDKCFISAAKIYCAISQSNNLIGRLILPDDYLKRKVYFNDFIYEINRQDNNLQALYSGGNIAIDAYNLTAVGGEIFFINRYDDRIYSLELL